MHLLINGLSARLGGGKTYLNQLLALVPTNWQVTLLSSGGFDAASLPSTITVLSLPNLANPFRRAWWERTQLEALAEARGCNMIFTPACLLPRMRSGRVKTAVTFQNMLPFDRVQRSHYPLFSYRRLRDFLLARALVSTMRRADLVIFISAYARNFIVQQCGVNPKQSALIPHALDPMFFVADHKPAPLLAEFPLKNEPYFLYVSFLDFYKSQREVIRAYAALRSQHQVTTKLVLVGTPYYKRYAALVKQDIEIFGLRDSVILLGNVPHATLPALYQNATLNLFASTTENWPNIVMEIMASDVPALVSNHGPMPEVAGDTVTYFDPTDHESFVAAWANLLQQMDTAKANAARAVALAKTYRWADAAQQTWRAMEMAIKST